MKSGQVKIAAFSDASQDAIGFCVYIYTLNKNSGNLLYSRSRLAENGNTIQELEYKALAWMVSDVHEVIRRFDPSTEIMKLYFYSDLTTAIQWVNNGRERFTAYIERIR
jgi:Pao retrotransposon peptidase